MDILDRLLDYERWITGQILERCALLSVDERQRQFDSRESMGESR